MQPLHSALETQFVEFLQSQSFANVGNRVYRTITTQEVTTPAVFVVAEKTTEQMVYDSGIYRIPFAIRVVYVTEDLQTNATALDTVTRQIELSLTGSRESINNNAGNSDLFIFGLTKQSTAIETVEHTYQNAIYCEAIAKSK